MYVKGDINVPVTPAGLENMCDNPAATIRALRVGFAETLNKLVEEVEITAARGGRDCDLLALAQSGAALTELRQLRRSGVVDSDNLEVEFSVAVNEEPGAAVDEVSGAGPSEELLLDEVSAWAAPGGGAVLVDELTEAFLADTETNFEKAIASVQAIDDVELVRVKVEDDAGHVLQTGQVLPATVTVLGAGSDAWNGEYERVEPYLYRKDDNHELYREPGACGAEVCAAKWRLGKKGKQGKQGFACYEHEKLGKDTSDDESPPTYILWSAVSTSGIDERCPEGENKEPPPELVTGVTCKCETPGAGAAGKNGFVCSDGNTRWCNAVEECYATEAFLKGEWTDGCRELLMS